MSGLGFGAGDVVVVTGAASGIGRATAKLAARSGLTVCGWDLASEPLESLVKEIAKWGGDVSSLVPPNVLKRLMERTSGT